MRFSITHLLLVAAILSGSLSWYWHEKPHMGDIRPLVCVDGSSYSFIHDYDYKLVYNGRKWELTGGEVIFIDPSGNCFEIGKIEQPNGKWKLWWSPVARDKVISHRFVNGYERYYNPSGVEWVGQNCTFMKEEAVTPSYSTFGPPSLSVNNGVWFPKDDKQTYAAREYGFHLQSISGY